MKQNDNLVSSWPFFVFFYCAWEVFQPNLSSFSVSFQCAVQKVFHLTIYFAVLGKISFFVINNIENNNNNNNKAFFIPALIKARRDNNFVLKHATDARRRKFSNDDGYVERARE